MPTPKAKPANDPWDEAAKNYQPQAGQPNPAENQGEDWKIWQQQDAQPDTRNGLQKFFDNATADVSPEQMAKEGKVGGAIHQGLHSFAGMALQPFVHPINTAKSVLKSAAEYSPMSEMQWAMSNDKVTLSPPGPGLDQVNAIKNDFQTMPLGQAVAKTGGQLAGAGAFSMLTDGALGTAGRMVRTPAAAMERGGYSVLNGAIDATPKMMKYGQNPARGLVDEGIAPSLSKFSLGNKVAERLPIAGQRVSDFIHAAPLRVPGEDISRSINTPIDEAVGIVQGPGGANRSAAPLEALRGSMAETAPGASAPIYRMANQGRATAPFDPTGPVANAPRFQGTADASAPDVWRTIQNVDRNTRFNPDPEVEGVNEVRRDVRGGLRQNLENAVPGLHPLSQRYGDLATAEEALSRNAGKGTSLKGIRQAMTFPVETGVGTGMVRMGRALQRTPPPIGKFLYAPDLIADRRKENQ